ncbi:MAG: acyl carrier protein [Planctomycetaceae bacterium]|nr:acyl carrier protein [Planctomycetaceae bacterium]
MPTEQEVFDKIRAALVDALGVDDDEVTPEATLVGDLGAESIDFLDIVFRLEKAFNIEIPRAELFPEDILTNAEYVQDGKVTDNGVSELKKRMPFADLSAFEANPLVQEFGNLLTVNDMVRYVSSKVNK